MQLPNFFIGRVNAEGIHLVNYSALQKLKKRWMFTLVKKRSLLLTPVKCYINSTPWSAIVKCPWFVERPFGKNSPNFQKCWGYFSLTSWGENHEKIYSFGEVQADFRAKSLLIRGQMSKQRVETWYIARLDNYPPDLPKILSKNYSASEVQTLKKWHIIPTSS